jgi:hypothetical protein
VIEPLPLGHGPAAAVRAPQQFLPLSRLRGRVGVGPGFISHTLSPDGDPCDVPVAKTRPMIPGAVIGIRPSGMLMMTDEAGGDEKDRCRAAAEADPALCARAMTFLPCRGNQPTINSLPYPSLCAKLD